MVRRRSIMVEMGGGGAAPASTSRQLFSAFLLAGLLMIIGVLELGPGLPAGQRYEGARVGVGGGGGGGVRPPPPTVPPREVAGLVVDRRR